MNELGFTGKIEDLIETENSRCKCDIILKVI